MNESEPPRLPPAKGGKVFYLFLMLLPAPIGMMVSQKLLKQFGEGQPNTPATVFVALMLLYCFTCALGLFDGYRQRNLVTWLGAFFVALVFTGLITFIIIFVGCCTGMGHL